MGQTDKNSTGASLLPGGSLSFALCFMLFLYAPYELFLTNRREFRFTAGQMLPYTLVLFASAFCLCLLALLLARAISPKLLVLCEGVLLFALIGFYVQGNFLVSGLPGMDGTEVDWNAYPTQRLLSCLCWAGSALLSFLLWRLLKTVRFLRVSGAAGAVLSLLLILTLGGLLLTNGGQSRAEANAVFFTDAQLFSMSEEENFIVLHLDALDAAAFEEVLSERPEYREAYEDFTYFDNTMSGYPFTKCSLPLLLTGQWYEAQEDFDSWVNDAMEASPLFQALLAKDYRLALYEMDNLKLSWKRMGGRLENSTTDGPTITSRPEMLKTMLRMAMVKYFPWDLKEIGYRLQEKLTTFLSLQRPDGTSLYLWDNLIFYDQLAEEDSIRLRADKSFKYIELKGAHVPNTTQADLKYNPDATYLDSVEASMKIAQTLIERMKAAGVYDNSVLVILGDHGYNYTDDKTYIRQHPMLMIKGRGERHPFAVDNAPVSHADLCDAFVRLLDGADSSACFDWHAGQQRERRFLNYSWTDLDRFEEYMQSGQAEDGETLLPTGRVFTR